MAFSIEEFKGAFANDGYRPSLFSVLLVGPHGFDTSLVVQATSVPAQTVGVVEAPYFGRKIKLAGDRTYAEWTTTVLCTEDMALRRHLEDWSTTINSGEGNLRNETPAQYKGLGLIQLYGKRSAGAKHNFFVNGIWPTDVGTLDLDWNTTDTIATFTVTWAFDYMLPTSFG